MCVCVRVRVCGELSGPLSQMYRPVEEQPACIQGLVLKEYQLQGVNWVLDTLINHHRNCILGVCVSPLFSNKP